MPKHVLVKAVIPTSNTLTGPQNTKPVYILKNIVILFTS